MKVSDLYGDILKGTSSAPVSESLTEKGGYEGVNGIQEAYETFVETSSPGSEEENYQRAVRSLEGVDYTLADFNAFLRTEWQREERKTELDDFDGLFVTALMDGLESEEFTLPDMETVSHVACWNEYDITVEGNAGRYFAPAMESGTVRIENHTANPGVLQEGGEIIVEGNVAKEAGDRMKGGRQVVSGDAESVGGGMEGGEVIIHGDVEYELGSEMEGGTIKVKGDANGQFPRRGMTGGEIYVDGEINEFFDFWVEEDAVVYQKQGEEYVELASGDNV